MKRILMISLFLALVLSIAYAQASPEDLYGKVLPDFSVKTISGSDFTLSNSLKTHDLVLINFWATWCPPCRMEFPALEEAWEQYADRMEVIALSVEETDTFGTLRGFAGENGLNFPIGRDTAGMFGNMGGTAIPTTLIVDRDRRVAAVEIGAKGSAEEFTDLFDSLLAGNHEPAGDESQTPGAATDTEGGAWICSACNARNSGEDVFCINCAQTRRCPECGNSVPVHDQYCSACGSKFAE